MFKILYRIYRVHSGVRYRAERRFTRAGLAVLGCAIVAGLMGPDTENNVAYQGFALLGSMLLAALPFAWTFRGRFSAERHLPRFGTVGVPLKYSVTISNHGSRLQSGLTLLEDLADPRPGYDDWVAAQFAESRAVRSFRLSQRRRTELLRSPVVKESGFLHIAPGGKTDAQLETVPFRRGLLQFSGVTLARPDPLGLCRALRRIKLPQTVLVLPRRYPLPPVALPGVMKYQHGGVAMAAHVGQSEEFVSLRDYREGDPLRHIHWRSWARTGKPVVREFEDEFFVRHALVLDTFSTPADSDLLEEGVSVAASFACTITTQESLLDLLFVGPESYCFTAGRGLAHADQMLEILASVRACSDKPFDMLEGLVLTHVRNVSGCICVLLAWDRPRQEFVRKLRALGLPVMVLVIVPPGKGPGVAPGVMSDDPRNFRALETDKIEAQLATLA